MEGLDPRLAPPAKPATADPQWVRFLGSELPCLMTGNTVMLLPSHGSRRPTKRILYEKKTLGQVWELPCPRVQALI